MKIGILTFHWGTNYGGVLQAYSLQENLLQLGYDAQIINYAPKTFRDSVFLCFDRHSLQKTLNNLESLAKERKFKNFRNKNLRLTERIYDLISLEQNIKSFDIVFVGSDQVWNPYIAKSYSKAYFLPFPMINKKKIAYAVSLGCNEYPSEISRIIKPWIRNFDYISVREKTAIKIIGNIIDNEKKIYQMPDPALLLSPLEIEQITKSFVNRFVDKKYILFYILQDNQIEINKCLLDLKKKTTVVKCKKGINSMSIEEWLLAIKGAETVYTNSFHGVVFSLLFHKPFYVFPVEGFFEGMNDRIYTLLSEFNLTNRILNKWDGISEVYAKQLIDWKSIDTKIAAIRSYGINFIKQCIL